MNITASDHFIQQWSQSDNDNVDAERGHHTIVSFVLTQPPASILSLCFPAMCCDAAEDLHLFLLITIK